MKRNEGNLVQETKKDSKKAYEPESEIEADKEALLHDIEIIREAVGRSQSLLRRIPFIFGLRPVLLLSGILVSLYGGGRYLMEVIYEGAAPSYQYVLLNGLLAAGAVAVVFLKIKCMMQLAKTDDASIDFVGLMREVYNRPFALLAGTAGFLAVGIPVWLSYIGQGSLILPVFGILAGVMMMGMIAIFDMREMISGAVWLIGCGYALLWLYEIINPWLALMLQLSVPMLLIWASAGRSGTAIRRKKGWPS